MLTAAVLASALAAAPALARTPLPEPIRHEFACAASPTGRLNYGPLFWREEVEAIDAVLAGRIEPQDFVLRMVALDPQGSGPNWRWLLAVGQKCPGAQA